MNRRDFAKIFAVSGLGAFLNSNVFAQHSDPRSKPSHDEVMKEYEKMMGGKKLKIGMLVYPGLFIQDLVGPLTVFEALMNKEIHLIWKNLEPITNLSGTTLLPIMPTTTFSNCPSDLDVLFVPGGVPGTFEMMKDDLVLGFLEEKAKTSKFVTSVCTGSLILGAAGLLKGKKATSHWIVHDSLRHFGAIPTAKRIVVDGNTITGGGVTAGIDFGLYIVALLRDQLYSETIQLYLEYDPAPPFNAGSPNSAPPMAKQILVEMFNGTDQLIKEIASKNK